jgi:hypothetical protein
MLLLDHDREPSHAAIAHALNGSVNIFFFECNEQLSLAIKS